MAVLQIASGYLVVAVNSLVEHPYCKPECSNVVSYTQLFHLQVFLVRKIVGRDAGTLYAMKVLKKATLKGNHRPFPHVESR